MYTMLPFMITTIILFLCGYAENCLNLVDDCGAKPNTLTDNTFAFISCQNKLGGYAKNGGCVHVPNGKYHLINVPINTSNIIYYMDKSVTFIAFNNTHSDPVFNVGLTNTFVQNVSILGWSESNKFVIDTTNGLAQRGIQLFGIDGFMLANIEILVKVTDGNARSAICFDYNRVNSTLLYHAMNGKVINITASDYPAGYGLTQIQSGENIHFENLDGTGGNTLRMETGALLFHLVWNLMDQVENPSCNLNRSSNVLIFIFSTRRYTNLIRSTWSQLDQIDLIDQVPH